MKRLFMIGFVAVLMVGLMAMPVLGQAQGSVVYEIDKETGEASIIDKVDGNARVFVGDKYDRTKCNQDQEVTIKTRAEVAQWSEVFLSGTKWNWYVRKPGDFFADTITAKVRSNGDLNVKFSGFGDLKYQGDYLEGAEEYIKTYYQATAVDETPDQDNWTSAAALNECTVPIDENPSHEDIEFKLWNRIKVVDCNSASTYLNSGTITIELANQKDFIHDGGYDDKDDGYFANR